MFVETIMEFALHIVRLKEAAPEARNNQTHFREKQRDLANEFNHFYSHSPYLFKFTCVKPHL